MSVLKASAALTILAIAVRFLGLLRDLVIVWVYGATAQTDAFYAVSNIVYTFYVVVNVSLNSAAIPYLGSVQRDEQWRARTRDLSIGFNLIFVILGAIASAMALFAPQIAQAMFAQASGEHRELLAIFILLCAPSMVILGCSGVFSGLLNSARVFRPVAMAPAVLNIAVILCVLILGRFYGIYSAVFGLIAGSLVFILMQIPAFYRLDYRHAASLKPPVKLLQNFLMPTVPIISAGLMVYAYAFIDIFISSRLGEGMLTATNIANKLVQVPQGVIAAGLSTVTFPMIAAHISEGRYSEASDLAQRITMAIFAMAFPVAIFMALTADFSIEILFGQSAMTDQSRQISAELFAVTAFALPALSVNIFVVRVLYALQQWRYVIFATTIGLIFKTTIGFFGADYIGKDAISLSTVIAYSLSTLLILLRIDQKMQGFLSGRILRRFLLMLGIFTAMTAGLYLLKASLPEGQSILSTWLKVIAVSAAWIAISLIAFKTVLGNEMRNISSLKRIA